MKIIAQILFGGSVLLSLPASAAKQVAEVDSITLMGDKLIISQTPTKLWKLNEEICVSRSHRLVGCGRVILSTATEATVKLAPRGKPKIAKIPAPLVEKKNPSPPPEIERKPTAEPSISVAENADSFKRFNVGLGLSTGFTYVLPLLRIQYAPWRDWAFGLLPVYLSTTSSGTTQVALGGLLTADYTLGKDPFLGFFAQLAAGVYLLSTSKGGIEQSDSRPAVAGSLGYRVTSEFGLNLGLQAGVQNVFQSKTIREISFQGLLPLFIADITYSF